MRPARISGFAVLVILAAALAACGERKETAAPGVAPLEELPADVPEPEAAIDELPDVEPEPAPAAPEPAAEPEAAAAPAAVAKAATVEIEIYKAGFIVGVSGGRGTLHFQGASYPLKIAGVSVGATAGISKAELLGEAQNLQRVSDIEGTYSAPQAGLALGGGEKITELKNSRGVVLKLRGKQIGIELSLDLNGMQISLAK